MSRRKGMRAEVDIVHILESYGYNCRRGDQSRGGKYEADVVGIPGLHIEVKRVEKPNLEKALEQSERDARIEETPVVIHRRNRERWKVTMSLEEFMLLWKRCNK